MPGVVSVLDVATTHTDEDSILWVLVEDSVPLVRLNLRSGQMDAFSRRGRGPTDVLFPWNFAAAGGRDTSPPIVDIGDMKLISFPSAGEPVSTELQPVMRRSSILSDFRAVFLGHPQKMLRIGGKWLWLEPGVAAHSDRDLWPLRLVSGTPSLGRSDTVVRRDIPGDLALHVELQTLIPVPLLARCHDNLAVLYLGDPDSLVWLNGQHEVVHSAASGIPRRALTAADRRNFMAPRVERERRSAGLPALDVGEMAKLLSSLDERFRSIAPDSTPRAEALWCDAQGTALLTAFPALEHASAVQKDRVLVRVSTSGVRHTFRLNAIEQIMLAVPGGLWTISDTAAAGAT
ncbi:MAG: hypothetical protein MUD17_11530, partial [Gemmatimonadaceae bacterium]|nr:hypothetical protein [Gemmatimonadaceae bacterium]